MSSYAGDVTPRMAFAALQADENATLVDVRTHAEWTYVGLPDLSGIGSDVVCVEWQSYPDGRVNTDFFAQLRTEGVSSGPVYFLCRSGARSQAAARAATEAGFEGAFNILDGFEGPVSPDGHRSVRGWKNDGLPWRQA